MPKTSRSPAAQVYCRRAVQPSSSAQASRASRTSVASPFAERRLDALDPVGGAVGGLRPAVGQVPWAHANFRARFDLRRKRGIAAPVVAEHEATAAAERPAVRGYVEYVCRYIERGDHKVRRPDAERSGKPGCGRAEGNRLPEFAR